MPSGDICDLLADVEDIEDIIGLNDVAPKSRYRNKPLMIPKVRKIKEKPVCKETPIPTIDSENTNFLQGSASVYVKTWGCAHNSSDSEYMAGQLAAQGYTITQEKDAADLWLLNSCTVKNPAEDHFKNEINKGLDNNKKVVVAGCVPQGKQTSEYLKGLSMIGVQQIDRVVEWWKKH